jgi:glycosyltransferase involved in cell wall biosynthesis
MKILIVSVFSNHLFNWVLQLKGSGHEVHWFDLNDANTYVKRIDFVQQTVKWKRRMEYPGRYWIKNNFTSLDTFIEKFNNRKFLDVFEKKFNEIKPDVIQSFEMHSACVPILGIMKKNPAIKWIYSAWGNDLFYYQNDPDKLENIKAVFGRLDYMFADCSRDYFIAKKHGFKGEYLGTYPGGGGYDFSSLNPMVSNFKSRKIILIKGYEHKFGRCNNVLDAILEIEEQLKDFEIVIFAATQKVLDKVKEPKFKEMNNLRVKQNIARGELLKLMGKSLIYIGNSISDGMANTLLESVIMGCFPIQSNPGGATAEIIEHGKNGFLIENPNNIKEIAMLIKQATKSPELLISATVYNTVNIKPLLERKYIKDQVLEKYQLVEHNL